MTLEEFQQLSTSAQESFVENGGKVVSSLPKQVELTSHDNTNDESSTNSSITQPAPSFNQLGIDFQDPIELLFFADDDIASGRVTLHPWQIQILMDFALGGQSDKTPFQAAIRACNGSGKDKYIIAPCCVWLSMRYKDTICPVTSSSGAQLDNQTCRYITRLCEAINKKVGIKLWNVKYREYSIDFNDGTKSEIYCYATDEPGKAEGYHPTRFNSRMGIFASEDKSIPDEINAALNRCSGYTHRVHASTPALPMGHFFDYCSTAVDRNTIKSVLDVKPIDWIHYLVEYKQCPHISENYAEQMARDTPGGRSSAVWKSQFMAEFGTTDEMVVIPYTFVWQAFNHIDQKTGEDKIKWIKEPFNKAGLDLSDGGAETVLLIRNGNKHLKTIPFKFDNTEDSLDFLEEKFKENELINRENLIFADCCGMGKPMLDSLKRRGWSNIRYIDSRHKALAPRVYSNRGTELFFHVRQLLERRELIIQRDDVLVRQLSTRYYKISTSNIHALLSKLEQRSRGYPSPDRADAFNLAFWDYKSTWVDNPIDYAPDKPFDKLKPEKVVGSFSMKNWANSGKDSLIAFQQKVHKRTDTTYLQQQIERYNKSKQLITK